MRTAPNEGRNLRAARLRTLLEQNDLVVAPCCYDALSARLIEQAGFEMTFMSGFSASASRIGMPDLGLMSYGEVVDQVRNIAEATTLPFVVDGDTGYGNAMNVLRTVKGLARAGAAAVMIEDQIAPKRCGHTPGKAVVDRDTAFERIKAAVDARAEEDVVILARTDACTDHGLTEAIDRAQAFHALGADITFVEAPQTETEMRQICEEVPGLCHGQHAGRRRHADPVAGRASRHGFQFGGLSADVAVLGHAPDRGYVGRAARGSGRPGQPYVFCRHARSDRVRRVLCNLTEIQSLT